MANLLKRKEFAALIGESSNYVGVYIGRNKIIEENKRIDTDHPVNKAFIAKLSVKSVNEINFKKPIKNVPDIIEKNIPDVENEIVIKLDKTVSKADVDYVKKQHEIKKLKTEISLKDLEYKKKKARILPLDFVIDWSARSTRGVFGETVNFGNLIIEDICNELDADIELKLKYKKKFKQGFNEILKKGIEKQEPEAINHAKEYALINKW